MRKRRYLAPWQRKSLETKDLESLGKEVTDRVDGGMDGMGKADGTQKARSEFLHALGGKPAIYHCVTRIAGGLRLFGFKEKEKLVETMRRYEAFCQVRVLTFCMMSNHTHILVEVPEAPEDRGKSWTDKQFLAHLSTLYYGEQMAEYRWKLNDFRKKGLDIAAEEFRDRFFARMWDLASFMKGINQVIAQWFNRTRERQGHLWGDRFKSVLVESGRAAQVIAAYIDLNPVRAGIVGDPKDYRWCGYAEAVAGVGRAREGLRWILFESIGAHLRNDKMAAERVTEWKEVARKYRMILFEAGEKTERDEKRNRGGISPERVREVLEKGGRLSEAELIHCKVRHFTDGLVVGSERFVNSVFELSREYFGRRRKTGARRLSRADTGLRSMRNIQKNPLSPPSA